MPGMKAGDGGDEDKVVCCEFSSYIWAQERHMGVVTRA